MKDKRRIIVVFIVIFVFTIAGYMFVQSRDSSESTVSEEPKEFTEIVETVTEAAVGIVTPSAVEKDSEPEKIEPNKKETKKAITKNKKENQSKSAKKKKKAAKQTKQENHRQSTSTASPTASSMPKSTTTPKATKEPVQSAQCEVLIQCKSILKQDSIEEHVPKNGIVLEKTTLTFRDGDTVYDVVYSICRQKEISFVCNYTGYIEGVANIFEKDYGAESGWMYRVNGRFPNVGVKGYKVSPKDKIELIYTCKRGDLNGSIF